MVLFVCCVGTTTRAGPQMQSKAGKINKTSPQPSLKVVKAEVAKLAGKAGSSAHPAMEVEAPSLDATDDDRREQLRVKIKGVDDCQHFVQRDVCSHSSELLRIGERKRSRRCRQP